MKRLPKRYRLIIFILFFTFIALVIGAIFSWISILFRDKIELDLDYKAFVPKNYILFEDQVATSPDGENTIFVIAKDSGLRNMQIWLMNKKGKLFTNVQSFETYRYASSPTWSPNGEYFVIFRFYPYEILLFDKNGNEVKSLYTLNEEDTEFPLFPSIGMGAKINLKWSGSDEVLFEDNKSVPNRILGININSSELREVEKKINEEKLLEEKIISYPSIKEEHKLNVPFFSQNDVRWKEDVLGGCENITIGSAGCAVTAVSMVLNYLGFDQDAKELDSLLSENNNQGYFDGCDIIWYLPVNFSEGLVMKGVYSSEYNLERLDYELDLGNPVIVGYDNVNFTNIPHWIVVTGKNSEGEYLTNDPWTGEEKPISYFGERFDHMVVYGKAEEFIP